MAARERWHDLEVTLSARTRNVRARCARPTVLVALLVTLVALTALVLAPPASATAVTVTLSSGAPSPAAARATAGDSLVFRNSDTLGHVVKAKSTNWRLSLTVPAGSSASYPLRTAGTFTYTDTSLLLQRAYTASVTVTVTAASDPGQSGPGGVQRYAQERLTQGSTHRYGLPVLLAVVAMVGVVTVLGRYLLAQPAAGSRRPGSGGPPADQPGGLSTDPGDSSK